VDVDAVAVGAQGPGAESSTGYEAANPSTGSIADLGAGFDTILSVGALAVCRDLAIFVERIVELLASDGQLLFLNPTLCLRHVCAQKETSLYQRRHHAEALGL